MPVTNEDCAGNNALYGTEYGKRSFLKLESRTVQRQLEILHAKRLPQPEVAKLLVNRVGIGVGTAFSGNADFRTLLGNRHFEVQRHGAMQLHRFVQRLKPL